jgi:hypothetical protein
MISCRHQKILGHGPKFQSVCITAEQSLLTTTIKVAHWTRLFLCARIGHRRE